MRNLLISLTFIFALIVFNSTDAFSQKGGGSMVDIFGLVFDLENDNTIGGTNIEEELSRRSSIVKVRITLSDGENILGYVEKIEREFSYNVFQNAPIEIPIDLDNAMNGNYYVEFWFNNVYLGDGDIDF